MVDGSVGDDERLHMGLFFSSKPAGPERRKHARSETNRPAWIDIGNGAPLIECVVLDTSEGGARFAVPNPATLPENFTLMFSPDGKDGRRCRVAWRSGTEAGVEYLSIAHYLLP